MNRISNVSESNERLSERKVLNTKEEFNTFIEDKEKSLDDVAVKLDDDKAEMLKVVISSRVMENSQVDLYKSLVEGMNAYTKKPNLKKIKNLQFSGEFDIKKFEEGGFDKEIKEKYLNEFAKTSLLSLGNERSLVVKKLRKLGEAYQYVHPGVGLGELSKAINIIQSAEEGNLTEVVYKNVLPFLRVNRGYLSDAYSMVENAVFEYEESHKETSSKLAKLKESVDPKVGLRVSPMNIKKPETIKEQGVGTTDTGERIVEVKSIKRNVWDGLRLPAAENLSIGTDALNRVNEMRYVYSGENYQKIDKFNGDQIFVDIMIDEIVKQDANALPKEIKSKYLDGGKFRDLGDRSVINLMAQYQKIKGLKVDGLFGNQTYNELLKDAKVKGINIVDRSKNTEEIAKLRKEKGLKLRNDGKLFREKRVSNTENIVLRDKKGTPLKGEAVKLINEKSLNAMRKLRDNTDNKVLNVLYDIIEQAEPGFLRKKGFPTRENLKDLSGENALMLLMKYQSIRGLKIDGVLGNNTKNMIMIDAGDLQINKEKTSNIALKNLVLSIDEKSSESDVYLTLNKIKDAEISLKEKYEMYGKVMKEINPKNEIFIGSSDLAKLKLKGTLYNMVLKGMSDDQILVQYNQFIENFRKDVVDMSYDYTNDATNLSKGKQVEGFKLTKESLMEDVRDVLKNQDSMENFLRKELNSIRVLKLDFDSKYDDV